MRRSGPPFLVLVLGVLGAGAPPASAAVSVSVTSDQGLRISASGSSATEISVRPFDSGSKLDVTEQSAQMVAGSGCTQVDSANPQRLRCNRPSLNFVTFTGGSGVDKLSVLAGSGDCSCFGNAGNDELRSANGADLIDGGTGEDFISASVGDDVIRGGDGGDVLIGGLGTDDAFGGSGNDVFDMGTVEDGTGDDVFGENDRDLVSYGGRRSRVVVNIDTVAGDGAPGIGLIGENDFIHAGTEEIRGGSGPDELTNGFALFGGPGDDRLRVRSTFTSLADGGTGSDVMIGGAFHDILLARDAIDDQVHGALSCGGSDVDTLQADIHDDDTRPLPTDCETIDFGMVGEDPAVHVRFARRGREGLTIGLRCAKKTRKGCAGKLAVGRLSDGNVRFGKRVGYELARGRRGTVTARVRGDGTPRRGAKIRVRASERGRLGPRMRFQTLTVRG